MVAFLRRSGGVILAAVQRNARENNLRRLALQKQQQERFGRTTTQLVGQERFYGVLFCILCANVFLLGLISFFEWIVPSFRWLVDFIPLELAVLLLLVIASGLAYGASVLRDRQQHPYYPVIEIAVGLSLSVTGSINGGTSMISVLAFLGGIRIMVDGYKRFNEFGCRSYFEALPDRLHVRWRYGIRSFKKALRKFDHAVDPPLNPAEIDELGYYSGYQLDFLDRCFPHGDALTRSRS
jgi:hypothetical protein